MLPTLSSREAIYDAAINLAGRLEQSYIDEKGKPFTRQVFSTLRNFCEEELGLSPDKDCSHRGHEGGREEFLWDFIAQRADTGILLVAESEQNSYNTELERLLKHDFEKLLYVYAPLRVLVFKSKDKEHADRVRKELEEYAHNCCLSFNPGAVLLIHFQLWEVDRKESQSFIWQSEGKPCEPRTELISFKRVE